MENLSAYKVSEAPDSVYYLRDYISREEEARLWQSVYKAPRPKWSVLRGRRLQNWGGLPHPKGMVPEPLPQWLAQLTERVSGAGVFGPAAANHVLVNEYPPGSGIMPHEDGPAYHPVVCTVSLGCHALLDLYAKSTGRFVGSLLLEPRSALVLQERAYSAHLHGISTGALWDLASAHRVLNWSLTALGRAGMRLEGGGAGGLRFRGNLGVGGENCGETEQMRVENLGSDKNMGVGGETRGEVEGKRLGNISSEENMSVGGGAEGRRVRDLISNQNSSDGKEVGEETEVEAVINLISDKNSEGRGGKREENEVNALTNSDSDRNTIIQKDSRTESDQNGTKNDSLNFNMGVIDENNLDIEKQCTKNFHSEKNISVTLKNGNENSSFEESEAMEGSRVLETPLSDGLYKFYPLPGAAAAVGAEIREELSLLSSFLSDSEAVEVEAKREAFEEQMKKVFHNPENDSNFDVTAHESNISGEDETQTTCDSKKAEKKSKQEALEKGAKKAFHSHQVDSNFDVTALESYIYGEGGALAPCEGLAGCGSPSRVVVGAVAGGGCCPALVLGRGTRVSLTIRRVEKVVKTKIFFGKK